MRKLLMAVLMLVATAGGASGAGQNASPIKIGMIEGMSAPFGHVGAAAARNLEFTIEQINARGGVRLPDGKHKLALSVFDGKKNINESLAQFRLLANHHIPFLVQGNVPRSRWH